MTGSASGGTGHRPAHLSARHYIDQGVDPEQLHRVVAIVLRRPGFPAHNGYVVTTIRAICKETHAGRLRPDGCADGDHLRVLGLILCLGLFAIGFFEKASGCHNNDRSVGRGDTPDGTMWRYPPEAGFKAQGSRLKENLKSDP